MAVVITLQAFLFADGGITALGANVLNMGVIGALLVGFVTVVLARRFAADRGMFLGITAAGTWLAVMIAATATSIELAATATIPLGTVLGAMLGVHALIGIGEAAITVAAVGAIMVARPDVIYALSSAGAERTPAIVPMPKEA
jgi:cobalt/nickel transport system permease protein